MVLDDYVKTWQEGLKRGNMDQCLQGVEKVRVTFRAGQTREIYVGGIFNGELWISYDVDEAGRLMPHIERFNLSLITSYKVIS